MLLQSATTDRWDPNAAGSGVAFSNNNSTVTASSGSSWRSIRSVKSFNSGSKYAECKIINWSGGQSNGLMFGCGNASLAVNNYTGNDANSFGLQFSTVQASPNQAWIIYSTNLTTAAQNCYLFPAGTAIGRTIGMAITISSGSAIAWFTVDGSTWNNGTANPTTTLGGAIVNLSTPLYLACSLLSSPLDSLQLVTRPPFTLSVPSGFTAWS